MGKHGKRRKDGRRYGRVTACGDVVFNLPMASHTVIQELDESFNRKYSYQTDKSVWKLPTVERLFDGLTNHWEDDELQMMKSSLNDVKSRLNDIDIISWQNHTQAMHKGGLIPGFIRHELHAELCTQAWCKFYAILGTFPNIVQPFIESSDHEFNSVHLCEAPGAFIASLNHFLACCGKHVKWQWLASTLNPYYEGNDLQSMIDDDRFIMASRDHWYFGSDNTGNIMNMHNIDGLLAACVQRGMKQLHLVTADGSIDCANEPGEQETKVSKLHYSETVAALQLLAPGGSFVLKMFTLFQQTSICLMFLLCCLFDKVSVFKPVTSKPGNSEVYVIAEQYKGTECDILAVLRSHVGGPASESSTLWPMFSITDIPESFLLQHRKCCARFMRWQTATIESNLLRYFERNSATLDCIEAERQLHQLKAYHVQMYLERFQLRPINTADRIICCMPEQQQRQPKVSSNLTNHVGPSVPVKRRYEGTLVNRQQTMKSSWQSRLQSLMENLHTEDADVVSSVMGIPLLTDAEISVWEIELGKPLQDICSSRFCSCVLLAHYREVLQHTKGPTLALLEPQTLLLRILHRVSGNLSGNEHICGVYGVDGTNLLPAATIDVPVIDSSTDETIDTACVSTLPTGTLLCAKLVLEPVENGRDIAYIVCMSPLADLIAVLKVIKTGHHCVVVAGPLLTRRMASILYIIQSCFSRVVVYTDGSLPQMFLIGLGFQSCCQSLLGYLIDSLQHTLPSNDSIKHTELLSVVPVNYLSEPTFKSFVHKVNDEFLKLRISFLLHGRQNEVDSSSSSPPAAVAAVELSS